MAASKESFTEYSLIVSGFNKLAKYFPTKQWVVPVVSIIGLYLGIYNIILSVDGFDVSRNIRAFIFNLFVLFVWLWYYNLNQINLFGLSFILYLNITPMKRAWFRSQWNMLSWFIAPIDKAWFHERLFFEVVIVVVKDEKTSKMQYQSKLVLWFTWSGQ